MAVAALERAGAQIMIGEAWALCYGLQGCLATGWVNRRRGRRGKHLPQQVRGLLPCLLQLLLLCNAARSAGAGLLLLLLLVLLWGARVLLHVCCRSSTGAALNKRALPLPCTDLLRLQHGHLPSLHHELHLCKGHL
jgi:hypothetical protein